jgi:hypothetical protein
MDIHIQPVIYPKNYSISFISRKKEEEKGFTNLIAANGVISTNYSPKADIIVNRVEKSIKQGQNPDHRYKIPKFSNQKRK